MLETTLVLKGAGEMHLCERRKGHRLIHGQEQRNLEAKEGVRLMAPQNKVQGE